MKFWAGMAVATACTIAAVWVADPVPQHDGPQHLYNAHVAAHLGEAGTRFAEVFRPSAQVSYKGFAALYRAFASFLAWDDAYRAAISCMTVLWGWSFSALVLAIDKRRWPLCFFGFASAYTWSLYLGFYNYFIATALMLLVIATAIASWPWNWKHRVGLSLLLYLQAICHPFSAGVTGVILFVLTALRSDDRSRLQELGQLVLVGVPSAYVAAKVALEFGLATRATEVDTLWLDGSERVRRLGACFVGGPIWRGWPIVLLGIVSLALAGARLSRKQLRPAETALGVSAACLLIASLLTPWHTAQWQFYSPRFIPPAILLAVVLLPVEALTKPRARIAALLSFVYALASVAWAGSYHRDLADRARGALAGLDAPIQRSGPRLPIVADPLVGRAFEHADAVMPHAQPLRNLGHLYALQQGGIAPYTFTFYESLAPIVTTGEGFPRLPGRMAWQPFVRPTPAPDAELRRSVLRQAAYGSAFEDIIYWGPSRFADDIIALGYAVDFREGDLLIARFEGCPRWLNVEGDTTPGQPLFVALGWGAQKAPIWLTKPYAATQATRTRFHLRQAPCGEFWLRIAYRPDDAPRSCVGAKDFTIRIDDKQRDDVTCVIQ